ncbi:LysM peptidoglycan-binding domain-containing protein [Listeria aquatica]|uniref:Peptidoglycan binding protein n=2 Tax=Listeria aquatica TaxID=1494960 RepID=W7AQ37_9LIST|nr:LysM peptidoglycan-binding domain-containing protein [Listeria aquatica]EUJ17284.1 peptidoglycan binding protein [Listeria aquatica FSL S10-1188]MBC1520759.1 LysM peptidoglycan-binding domain-containing protein [Listeria aquatica]
MKKNVLKMAVATLTVGVTTVVGGHLANAESVSVAKGDTLSKIANEHNTTVANLAQLNGIANINLIYVGQSLEVGNGGATQTAQPATQAAASQGQATTQKQQAPSQSQTQSSQPRQQQATQQTQTQAKPANTGSSSDQQAKEWIAQRESGGSYGARSASGKYIGRYQLTNSYLKGDYSQANQERVANSYVQSRYGSWSNAKAHHEQYGWY